MTNDERWNRIVGLLEEATSVKAPGMRTLLLARAREVWAKDPTVPAVLGLGFIAGLIYGYFAGFITWG